MSESYGPISTSSAEAPSTRRTATVGTADATDVKDTAIAEAGNVVETAKEEAATVAAEAKSQAKSLYAQTQRELRDQAGKQQQRAADGLRSAGEELRVMASSTPSPGLATDLVRQAASRVSGAASWLGDRDPDSLLAEVKSFARRKPGVFIGIAVLAGIAAGRLARALAEGSADRRADMADGASRAGTGAAALTSRATTRTGADADDWSGDGSPTTRADARPGANGYPVSDFDHSPRGESAGTTDWAGDQPQEGTDDGRRNDSF